jgi:hypothetical protein
VRCHFWERRGHRGGSSTRGRWRWRYPVGLPEEEDNRPTDRAGPPVSAGEAVGQAGLEGEGVRWAVAGPERGGRDVARGWAGSWKWLDKILRILFGIWIFGKIWKFAHGDSKGILIWGFFLKSSRLLKDF